MGYTPTLKEIAEGHKRIILDGSILRRRQDSTQDRRYREEFIRLITESEKIITTPEVIREVEIGAKHNPFLRRFPLYAPNERENPFNLCKALRNYLEESAEDFGLVDSSKAEPYADLSVACLAITAIHQRQRVALLSGDRRLNAFTKIWLSKVGEGDEYERGFPLLVRGSLNIFYPSRNNGYFELDTSRRTARSLSII